MRGRMTKTKIAQTIEMGKFDDYVKKRKDNRKANKEERQMKRKEKTKQITI